MNKGKWKHAETKDEISMEEYLYKRQRIREEEKRRQKKESDTAKLRGLTPLEFYMVSSLSWS